MARIAAQRAATQLLGSLVNVGMSMFGGGAAAASTSAGASASGYTGDAFSSWAAAQADGGAWSGGVQFFAQGGAFTNSVVTRPTAFGMAGGQAGVMGEAGPEAILPLARAADGSLGVRAVGGGAAGGGNTLVQVNAPVAVTVADRSDEGMQIDQQALQQSMQQQMRGVAERVIADSWRPGGISHRSSSGRA
ncbi:hypothetical protein D3C76_365400 [compost metagenome]